MNKENSYKVALGLALFGALFLLWLNGAVGLIGSESQPANFLYAFVVLAGIAGTIWFELKPEGMAHTMMVVAALQFWIPIASIVVWPDLSWGSAGILGVFVLNTFFVVLFAISAFFFSLANEK